MKKNIILFCCLLVTLPLLASTNNYFNKGALPNQQIKTLIKSVTLFPNGAEIYRSAKIPLRAGTANIVISGLSPKIDANSLQINALGEQISVLAVSSRVGNVEVNNSLELMMMKDSINLLIDQVAALEGEKDGYLHEKQLMENNNSLGGEKGITISEIKEAAQYYRTRITAINNKIAILNKRMREKGDVQQDLKKRYDALGEREVSLQSQVIITMNTVDATLCKLELRYMVNDASWQPVYNLRTVDITDPVMLEYKAQITNNTGIDWQDVLLELSTHVPNKKIEMPSLEAWTLNKEAEIILATDQKPQYDYASTGEQEQTEEELAESTLNSTNTNENNLNINAETEKGDVHFKIQQTAMQKESISDGLYSQESPFKPSNSGLKKAAKKRRSSFDSAKLSNKFLIKDKHSIVANDAPYLLDIDNYQLDASFQHFCIPKVDEGVFLLAKIFGFNQYTLLEGPASVYYNNTYIGESYIDSKSIDTLDLSLGIDDLIVVSRLEKGKTTEQKLLKSSITKAQEYEIIVQNNRTTPIIIELQDQVPVSKERGIQVNVSETSNARRNLKNGTLMWTHHLAPDEVAINTVAFSVKYPKRKKNGRKLLGGLKKQETSEYVNINK